MKPTTSANSLLDKRMLVAIMLDMRTLYDEIRGGQTDIRTASELANVAGKSLKAYQLILATEIFTEQLGQKISITPLQALTA